MSDCVDMMVRNLSLAWTHDAIVYQISEKSNNPRRSYSYLKVENLETSNDRLIILLF